ncbi:PAS domain-containing hybrid sensor histidine kinase/response regulator [Hydrogenophaga sp.]|uniref:PAS domain-containing hybrid sensor histidine kinase/response regulator n=1 Tax=Hydrogenophaga sp. TaxID=1904254 RepID=UPI003F70ADD2
MPGLAAEVLPDGSVVEASDAFVSLVGKDRLPRQWLARLSPGSRGRLTRLLAQQADFQVSLEWSNGDAGTTWLACSGWWSPEQRRHTCFLADVTATETSREAAQLFIHRLHLVFDHLPLMVAYHGPLPEGRCLFANRQYANLFGLDDKTILGKPVRDIVGKVLMQEMVRQARSFFEQHATVVYPCSVPQGDGRWMRLEVTMVPDAGPDGQVRGAYVLMTDITQRYETERALRESEDRLARFMEASAEGVVFHRGGLITDVNPAACALYGADAAHLLGTPTMSLVVPEFREKAQRMADSRTETAYESAIFNARGEHIPVEVIGRSIQHGGQPLRVTVVRDIRDRREAQARIEELISGLRAEKERAEAADRAKSVFLAAASHDLRQPIHALGLFLTALRSMAQAPAVPARDLSDICRRMQASLDGLGQLLNMLLDVSRLDANAVEIAPEPTDLGLLLRELEQDFQHLAHEKGLRLRVAPCSLWVHTDPTVLRRILSNLLSNAVRYTPRGRILLGCRRRASELDIQVWDTGIGIPPEQREAIFEEFYQVGQSTAQHHESHGLGLGLSIVKRSAQLLQAPMGLRSQPARGSMFFIRLPRCAAPARAPSPALAPAYPGSTRGLGVLVIDDDAQVLDAMQRVLSVWGHRVFCASSADEAVVIAITHPEQIHLLLSDYRLGAHVTAVDAIRAVQACLPHPVPTYILTGDTSPQRILEASALGFPLMYKPIDAQVLRAALEAR